MSDYITVKEFIKQVWDIERVKVMVPLPSDRLIAPYPYKTPMPDDCSINDLLEQRLNPHLQKAIAN
jgi:hypothetical protein